MMHADKSKLPPAKKAQVLPDASKAPDLKGKALTEQLASLAPKDTVAPPTTTQATKAPDVEAAASVAAVREAPPQVETPQVEPPQKEVEPKVEDKAQEPKVEDKQPKVEDKQPVVEDKPKEPTKKELRQQKAELRKQTQIANGDKVREERAKRPKPSKKDLENSEKVKEHEKHKGTDKLLWELKVKAENLMGRIDRVEESLKKDIKTTHKETALQVIAAASQKGADPTALGLQLDGAIQEFEKDFSGANYKPRSSVQTSVKNMKLTGLDEALKYADPTLRAAWDKVDMAIAREQWVAAKALIPTLESAFNAMKDHLRYFSTFIDKRLPWLRGKLGGTADTVLATTMSAVNGRYKLDADGLKSLRNKLDSTTFGTTERQHTTQEFEAVKGNDTNASAKLDELADHGVIRSGGLAQKYTSSWDTGGGYSVEYTVLGIPQIVIHCHCDSSGSPKSGANASHWKLKTEKFAPGTSHPVSKGLLDKFIDKEANKNAKLQPKY
jgi:hypothetical protein